MDPAIMVSPIKYRFIDETGADAQGVSQEAYSAFWKDFFETSSVRETDRVPALFLIMVEKNGKALAEYYPIQLSYTFSCASIYGEAEISGDFFLGSLRMYLLDVSTDRCVVDKALLGNLIIMTTMIFSTSWEGSTATRSHQRMTFGP